MGERPTTTLLAKHAPASKPQPETTMPIDSTNPETAQVLASLELPNGDTATLTRISGPYRYRLSFGPAAFQVSWTTNGLWVEYSDCCVCGKCVIYLKTHVAIEVFNQAKEHLFPTPPRGWINGYGRKSAAFHIAICQVIESELLGKPL